MTIILSCIVLTVLLNLSYVMRARNQRRFAEAKLRLARAVTAMERIMLEGHTRLGHVCHDHVYQDMLKSLYAEKYTVSWKIWSRNKPKEEIEQFRTKLREETEKNREIGNLLGQFIEAEFAAFRFNRPVVALLFAAWVAACLVGFSVLLMGLITIYKARTNWRAFYKTVAEYYYAVQAANAQSPTLSRP